MSRSALTPMGLTARSRHQESGDGVLPGELNQLWASLSLNVSISKMGALLLVYSTPWGC